MSGREGDLQAELVRLAEALASRTRAAEITERRLAEARSDARALAQTNEKLNHTLREAKESLIELRERLDALGRPPASYGVVLRPAGQEADVWASGRALRVVLAPEVGELAVGDTILLNEALTVTGRGEPWGAGETVRLAEALPDGLLLVSAAGDDQQLMLRAAALADADLTPGDLLLADRRAQVAFAVIPRSDVVELQLLETPDVSWRDIGGLEAQIEQIRDAVELPFAHRDLFARYGLAAPKGVLLYGPPGCGKTMIAKAVAASTGGLFLNVKGPELLNKYVGETERQIRTIFGYARTLASQGRPVVVFFDEMDALFRTRGSGVSSDLEATVVPQLLAELDGVEELENVIVIGATNREDLIDPAILRPGRLDVKIKLDRPDADGAAEILARHLSEVVPLAQGATRAALIETAVSSLFARTPTREFVEVTYASGAREVLYVADFVSGAMLANVVARAKKAAVKDELQGRGVGVSRAHVEGAIDAEVAENADLPNTTNPDDWARVAGRKGERITFLRTLAGGRVINTEA